MRAMIDMDQAGFSLIEALVSLIVVSVGMIGIAALYGQGLSQGRTALYRTQAVNLAADMGDRIRVNRLGGLAYNNAPANRNCDPGGNTDCTPVQMAEHDLWVWTNQVVQLLPGGLGTIQVVNGNPPSYTIRVQWQETGIQAGQAASAYQLVIQVPPL